MQLTGQKIKQLREQKGWSQDLLAQESGLSLRTIQRVEVSDKASNESMQAIAAALQIMPEQLQPAAVESKHEQQLFQWANSRLRTSSAMLILLAASLLLLVYLASDLRHYIDLPVLMFMGVLITLTMILSYGRQGALDTLTAIKYLFNSHHPSVNQATQICRRSQHLIRYTYASAAIIALIGLIAVSIDASAFTQQDQWRTLLSQSMPVLLLPFLYAMVLNETLLRPLICKLSQNK
ncbi:helix-turn-helix domain-containing protein [Shewanella sp. NFH-SH190041]|uniref:helix-turn-helix domain-containing protein n=1 Tax=Shewanella sp. NFH-SH190041 TaxID=2950245 RepID=UPI0021C27C71|nr:helix-turn-helix transcriptional regulator [Shewanella sp. NFH-SH190041]